MTQTFKPESEEQVVEAVQWAVSNKQALELVGTGTKRAIGKPIDIADKLDLSALTGIDLYEPEELVLSLKSATRLADVKQLLAENNQSLAFEPPDFSHLLNSNEAGTVGGMVASGLSGPRRIQAGGVRDHVLGVRGVSGHAQLFKTGGRVMKNVTGYDLPKILTGSWGTLAAMTQLTLKVLPKPETGQTLALHGLSDEKAIAALARALAAPVDVSGGAHLPGKQTLIRVEGFEPSVKARLEHLKTALADFGDMDIIGEKESVNLWRDIRDVRLLSNCAENALWRISVAPCDGPKVLAKITEKLEVNAFFDWGGGLIWVEVLNETRACGAEIRGAFSGLGGHATLIRAPEKSRAGSAVFQPQNEVLTALSDRLKAAFDPLDILNPGRMR